jgi:rhodanese-related sulfurtransferase
MLFDRYRSKKPISNNNNEKPTTVKKSSLANSFLKRFPIHLSTNKKKHLKKHDDIIINQPRPSLSLPNITTIIDEPPAAPPIKPRKPSIPTSKQRKRHSAEQRHRRHHLVSMQDVNRHSFTFGHFPSNDKQLTMAELSLDPGQLAKLKNLSTKDNTEALLAKLGNTQPHVLVPHRSISHQHLTVPTRLSLLSRAHSESHAKTMEREANPIEPQELVELLASEDNQEIDVILIDVRNLMDYQKKRIRGSINVNLPSLLIKRYQRGAVANFNLENFITTSEGRDIYVSKHHINQQQQQQQLEFSTILGQKAAEQQKKKKKTWVVYDDTMSEDDQTSQAWTLLNVLERFIGADKKSEGQVYYLCGGYQAFESTVSDETWSESSHVSSLPSPPSSTSSTGSPHLQLQPPQLKLNTTNNIPRRSISYTIGESKNDLNKRTSLFSLDTQAARVNNANALARRAKRRSQQQQQQDTTLRPRSTVQLEPNQLSTQSLQLQQPLPTLLLQQQQQQQNNLLNRVTEDDEMGLMTADISPRTESDFGFIISEIIPGFLFVGPEIETDDQAKQLTEERQIKRVLNMAEECQDEGLRNHTVVYHKIAARDTLEMKNIELVMMEAVHFIGKNKKKKNAS